MAARTKRGPPFFSTSVAVERRSSNDISFPRGHTNDIHASRCWHYTAAVQVRRGERGIVLYIPRGRRRHPPPYGSPAAYRTFSFPTFAHSSGRCGSHEQPARGRTVLRPPSPFLKPPYAHYAGRTSPLSPPSSTLARDFVNCSAEGKVKHSYLAISLPVKRHCRERAANLHRARRRRGQIDHTVPFRRWLQ